MYYYYREYCQYPQQIGVNYSACFFRLDNNLSPVGVEVFVYNGENETRRKSSKKRMFVCILRKIADSGLECKKNLHGYNPVEIEKIRRW